MSRMASVHFVNYKRGTQSRAAMRGVMLYVMQEKKTAWEGGPLVSGINCQPQSVYDDFLNTKYSSKWIDWLPDFSLLVALKWIMLVLILGTAALAGWYGAAAIRGLFL